MPARPAASAPSAARSTHTTTATLSKEAKQLQRTGQASKQQGKAARSKIPAPPQLSRPLGQPKGTKGTAVGVQAGERDVLPHNQLSCRSFLQTSAVLRSQILSLHALSFDQWKPICKEIMHETSSAALTPQTASQLLQIPAMVMQQGVLAGSAS